MRPNVDATPGRGKTVADSVWRRPEKCSSDRIIPFRLIDGAFDQQLQTVMESLTEVTEDTEELRSVLRVLCALCESDFSFVINECTVG
jgi:hypothetical protein